MPLFKLVFFQVVRLREREKKAIPGPRICHIWWGWTNPTEILVITGRLAIRWSGGCCAGPPSSLSNWNHGLWSEQRFGCGFIIIWSSTKLPAELTKKSPSKDGWINPVWTTSVILENCPGYIFWGQHAEKIVGVKFHAYDQMRDWHYLYILFCLRQVGLFVL